MNINSPEYSLFKARIEDILSQAEGGGFPCFSGFLDEGQQAIALGLAFSIHSSCKLMLWGGFEAAERQMLGAFPPYLEPESASFPLTPVTLKFRRSDTLSHRDFLGSLMGLGLKREAVGDILTEQGRAVLFLKEPLGAFVAESLCKVGRVGVEAALGASEPLPQGSGFAPLSGTVSSLRLDCLVSLFAGCSRNQACELIRSGLVAVNGVQTEKTSQLILEASKLSIRGCGKFMIDEIGSPTKKGRLRVNGRKYL
ncbi:MAG: hypothetical protein LBS74_04615 [Oscillospiraceae bacterium]|nr:hypothetical protein [Oscillospiraceae bacterium]